VWQNPIAPHLFAYQGYMEQEETKMERTETERQEITAAEAMVILGYADPSSIHKLARAGRLRGRKIPTFAGQEWSLEKSSVLEFKEKLKAGGEKAVRNQELVGKIEEEETERKTNGNRTEDERKTDDRYINHLEKENERLIEERKESEKRFAFVFQKYHEVNEERVMLRTENSNLKLRLKVGDSQTDPEERGLPRVVEEEVKEL